MLPIIAAFAFITVILFIIFSIKKEKREVDSKKSEN